MLTMTKKLFSRNCNYFMYPENKYRKALILLYLFNYAPLGKFDI